MRYMPEAVLTLGAVLGVFAWQSARGQQTPPPAAAAGTISPEKVTQLGLYVTAKEAYEKWKADPQKVKILDVRTPEEYAFVGHAEMAWNVPLLFMAYEWDAEKNRPVMKRNPDFMARVKETFVQEDTILVICRSGQRSKIVCDMLAEGGFKRAYNVVDGMEGDAVRNPGRPDVGKRTLNGWKNAGLPWTYEIDAKLIYLVPKK
ncbi:MAG: rhodanese-like domain-containing protein [Pirellulaceae bacterium]